MNTRSLRRSLWLLAVLIVLLGGGAATLLLTVPLDLPEESVTISPKATAQNEDKSDLPSLAELVRVSSLDIRKRLFDPPPPPPKIEPPKPKKPPPAVKLLGTVLHPSEPVAMIADASGQVTFKKLGDAVGAEDNMAIVSAIERTLVRLEHEGETLEISLEKGSHR